MPSAYEKAIAEQAIGSIARITAPENPAAVYMSGNNMLGYSPQKAYEGRASIADVVRTQSDKQPMDLYSNPVKSMRENNPQKDIYASLLNYKSIN